MRIRGSQRTSKMVTARKAYAGPSCKVFFPFNEGSGSVFTDIVGGAVFTATTVDHTIDPHAPTVGTTSDVALTSGSFPQIAAGQSLIFGTIRRIDTSASFNNFSIGGVGVGSYGVDADSGFGLRTPNGDGHDNITFASQSDNDYVICGGTYDGVTGEMRAYTGINGAGVALDDTLDASQQLGAIPINPIVRCGSDQFPPSVYGAWLYVVDDLPAESELIIAYDWMDNAMRAGHKALYPPWVSL